MKKSILLVLLAVLMLISSCSGSTSGNGNGDRKVAVTVGGKEIDEVEMLYHYKEAISNFYNENYNLVSKISGMILNNLRYVGFLESKEKRVKMR